MGLAPKSLNDIYADISSIAGIMHTPERGQYLIREMQMEIGRVRGRYACNEERRRIYCEEWGKPLIQSQRWVAELVEAVGAHPIVMDAVTHDRLVAGVSHAAFLLSVGYVLALSRRQEWPEASRLAAGGFRDISRLAAGDPDLYAGVVRTNRENLIEMLDAISAELSRLRRHLEADDPRLIELFEEARSVRERWARK